MKTIIVIAMILAGTCNSEPKVVTTETGSGTMGPPTRMIDTCETVEVKDVTVLEK